MSYYFELHGATIWNPSLRVAGLYLGYVDATSGLIGLDTGLSPAEDDTCSIDLMTFRRFCEGLASWSGTTRNQVFHSLVDGVLSTSIVMLDRCDGGRLQSRVSPEILDRARLHARSM